jgi:two-component system, OmpR family, phosphate regulon sensor histidine kinase PhoR
MNWLRRSKRTLSRPSRKHSAGAPRQPMDCNASRTRLILKRSLRSTTSYGAVYTIWRTATAGVCKELRFTSSTGSSTRQSGWHCKPMPTQRALEVRRRREDYLAFVAHDLRTPLSAISFAGKVLERTLPTAGANSNTARMLKALRRNVQHLEKLVDKVLEENTNLQTEIGIKLQRREVDLWPLVEALTHDLHPVAGTSSTQLINNVPDDLVVYADASLLRRVFQNLISNAIKYTPRGEIIIGASGPDAVGAIECSVSDNGAGIPGELLEKIFEKGASDKDGDGGTGLGLAIVKSFIEAHGGCVTVESKQGVGSTFRFALPGKAVSEGCAPQ